MKFFNTLEEFNSLKIKSINYTGGQIGMGSFQSNLLIFQPIIQTSKLKIGLGGISGKSKPL